MELLERGLDRQAEPLTPEQREWAKAARASIEHGEPQIPNNPTFNTK